MKLKACEMCLRKVLNTHYLTVCSDCDEEMDRKQEAADIVTNYLWGLKHKCRKCFAPLSPNRYFDCVQCLPDASRQTAWEYDTHPDTDVGPEREEQAIIRMEARNVTHKRCGGPRRKGCGKTLPVSDYYKNPVQVDGLMSVCSTCVSRERKEKRLKKQLWEVQDELRAL